MKKLLILALVLVSVRLLAQPAKQWTKKEAEKWFYEYVWLQNLPLEPNSSIDKLEFAQQYHAHKQWWDEAISYLSKTDLAQLAPGTYQIDSGNVFAKVTEAATRSETEAKWEAHRDYYDVHVIIKGKEQIGVGLLSSAKEAEAYDASRDLGFYTGTGGFYPAAPGNIFIISPRQIHKPGVMAEKAAVVKKVVIKVRCR